MSNEEDEDALLQSLQATRHDQTVYEEQVIREATHQLAPTLTGIGFPALDTLIHHSSKGNGGSHSSNLPHLHGVLSKTRKALQQQEGQQQFDHNATTTNCDLLHLKEQILLEYMHRVAQVPMEDLPVRPNEEQRLRKRRQVALSQPPSLESAPSQSEARRHDAAAVPSVQSLSGAGRRRGKTRVPMMVHKRQEEAPEVLDDEQPRKLRVKEESVEFTDNKTASQREELKRLRNERRQLLEARRQSRNKRWEAQQSSSSEEEEEGEREFEEPENTDDKGTASNDENVKENDDNKGDTKSLREPLICPICNMSVEYENESQKDSALAAHMESCQHQGRTTRRSKRLGGNNNVSFRHEVKEEAQDILDDSYNRPKSTRKRKRNAKISVAEPVTKQSRDPLDDMNEIDYEDRVDDWVEHGIGRMREMAERDDPDGTLGAGGARDYGHGLLVPAWINDRLFGYQRDGLEFMWNWHKEEAGGILGDEMGLGKTVSVSAFLGSLASCRKMRSCLIVVPATMLNHWLAELAIWAPGLRRILIHPSGEVDQIPRTLTPKMLAMLDKWLRRCRSNRINECIDEEDLDTLPAHSFCGTGYAIVTTYENVRRNSSIYVGHNFSYIVLDEAQKIRNPDADITLACKRFSTPHRIAMSGTPIMNDLRELWSIVDFCFPGRLGTLPAFEQEFADPIKKGGYSNASPMQAQLAYRCALVLRDLIEPYLLRRLKKDVKEVSRMPSKTEHVLFCRLSDRQRTLYESYLRSDAVAKVMRGTSNLLGAITMLRKICNHPDLVCDPNEGSLERFVKNGFSNDYVESDDDEDCEDDIQEEETLMERSGKLEVLSKILPLWKKQGHRVLIFCQWRKMLNIVQQFMMMRGYKFARLDGNTNVAARQRLVDTFNSDESYFAMLCTTRTGGVGLNLTGASRVCLYSPDWNPQIDAQARERAWRFGQKKEVTVYRLITAGTVEEKIYQRQIFKTALSNRVLQDPRQRRLFSASDLRDLFTLKHDSGSIQAGGHGVTETGEKTRGAGVIDVENQQEQETNLRDVMRSKGLAAIFDHNVVENSSSGKAPSAEMEHEAKRVAREAAKALRESVSSNGHQGLGEAQRFGVPGGPLSQGSNVPGSSQGLLASLRQRTATVRASDKPVENRNDYTQLLLRIKEYVRKRRPSTDDILKAFSDISSNDIAIFRQLLKSVAKLENGRWMPS